MKPLSLSLALFTAVSALADKRDVINPIGEENLGFLEIKEPKWSSPEEAHTFPYTLSYRGTSVNPGVKLRILQGDGCLVLSSPQIYGNHQVCGIKVEAKKTTTIELAGLVVSYDPKNKLSVDFGPKATLKVTRDGNYFAGGGDTAFMGNAKQGLIVLPGKYEFSFGVSSLRPETETIVGGKVYHVDLTPAEVRVTVRVKAPQRTFPDATTGGCNTAGRSFLIHRSSVAKSGFLEAHPYDVKNNSASYNPALGILSYKNFNLAQDSEFRAFPIGKAEAPQNYAYVVNNLSLPITAEHSQDTVDVVVKRIDVNDVLVTNEQGQQQYYKGYYMVEQRDEAGKFSPVTIYKTYYNDCSGSSMTNVTWFPTKTGIDVLPGYYRVVVEYTTAEGKKTAQYEADLQ